MPGPAPKPLDARSRARTHKASTRAVLHEIDPEGVDIPELPVRHDDGGAVIPWTEQALAWWADIWSSPMSSEFHSSDIHGLFRLAQLVDSFWNPESGNRQLLVAAEIRLAQKDYGLTPLDRRRLEWTIESARKASDEGQRRRATAPPAPAEPGDDPRLRLA